MTFRGAAGGVASEETDSPESDLTMSEDGSERGPEEEAIGESE